MLQLNTGNLQRVLKDFYTLTKIRIALFDSDFRELLSYPEEQTGFCNALRRDEKQAAACRESDRKGCLRCAQSRALVVYRCHAGLTEAVMPITERDHILGYVMFGQILPEPNPRLVEEFPRLAEQIRQIPVKSPEDLDAAATVLQMLTAYVISNHWVAPGQHEFLQKLDRYIGQHLARDITVEELCGEFHISRTRLYRLAAAYLDCGLMEYVRNQRIAHAKRLLRETDLSVAAIAGAVGFTEYNYFSRIFRKSCGCSARAYRAQKE